jgi:two-component system LytT family response regulator
VLIKFLILARECVNAAEITMENFQDPEKKWVDPNSTDYMIRSIIVDDEPKNVRILRGLLKEFCPSVQILDEANSADTAIPVIRKHQPDLVFLDIEMPFGNAFDLLDKLKPVDFEIIFITAFDDYTLKAFKYSALDYLLKPVNIDELRDAVTKAGNRIAKKNLDKQISNLFHNFAKPQASLQRMAFPEKDGTLVFVELKEIIRLESKNGYTYVHIRDRAPFISARTVKEYETLLPPELFFRVHNSTIINISRIRKYHKGRGGMVEMDDGATIEVATRRRDEFLSKFSIE